MAKFRTSPNEDEIQSYLSNAAAGGALAGVDPRAVKRANSNYPRARARGFFQVAGQIQGNQAAAQKTAQADQEHGGRRPWPGRNRRRPTGWPGSRRRPTRPPASAPCGPPPGSGPPPTEADPENPTKQGLN